MASKISRDKLNFVFETIKLKRLNSIFVKWKKIIVDNTNSKPKYRKSILRKTEYEDYRQCKNDFTLVSMNKADRFRQINLIKKVFETSKIIHRRNLILRE